MSAFICSQEHIKQLVLYAIENDQYGHLVKKYGNGDGLLAANTLANILYAQNVRSVAERYDDVDFECLPGPIQKPEVIQITEWDRVKVTDPVWILKMCACYEYQACETDDWYDTEAFRIIDEIRSIAVQSLPGYEEAPWEYTEEQFLESKRR